MLRIIYRSVKYIFLFKARSGHMLSFLPPRGFYIIIQTRFHQIPYDMKLLNCQYVRYLLISKIILYLNVISEPATHYTLLIL